MQKFLVLDGNSLIYRAFHALPLLSNRRGIFTNAAMGFTVMLLKLLRSEEPAFIAVAFDKGRTFRHDEFPEYKTQRKPMPEELRPQFAIVKNILGALNIPVFEMEGFEADDVIGTLVTEAEGKGLHSVIVTGDRDALQLVSEDTEVMLTKKGISELETYDLEAIREKYEVEPGQLIDVKALMGDASDNIPGVPGVGEKTALKLVQEFKSVGNLMCNLDRTKKTVAEKLAACSDRVEMNRHLVTIEKGVPLDADPQACARQLPDYQQLLQIFDELEFKRLTKEILEEMKESAPVQQAGGGSRSDYVCLQSLKELKGYLEGLEPEERLAVFPLFERGNGGRKDLLCLALAGRGPVRVLDLQEPCNREETAEYLSRAFDRLRPVFHDSKRALTALLGPEDTFPAHFDDTMIAAYLLNPSSSEYDLQQLAMEHLGRTVVEPDSLLERAAVYSGIVLELADVLPGLLKTADLMPLYAEVELPLAGVLYKMETRGVAVDPDILREMSGELGTEIDRMSAEIYALAGEEFNINSPRQLGQILFEKLDLPMKKKTKTGYSTSAEVLEELSQQHEIADKVLMFRHLVKLKSTYVDGLYKLVDKKTGRLHTTFNQTITATGRLSSTEPNLQNIPVRMELGRKIRKVFVPRDPEWVLLAADYSQIELRVLAHLSGDENLKAAFFENQDIHTRTASEVFGVDVEDVDRDMRRMAKAVNFGIIYGISDFGLARDLGISRQEAYGYIQQYFRRYPGVKGYMDGVVAKAREEGFATTLLKRRRYLPDLFSSNRAIRNFGERTAMNTPIQGSAADIIKLAMLKADAEVERQRLSAAMLLQVHDELIFEVPRDELETAARVVKDAMETAYAMDVPLVADLKSGPNWYEMHPWGQA